MHHSIVIPHRRRVWNLAACLRSLQRSADATGVHDYEVIVVNDREEPLLRSVFPTTPHLRIIDLYRASKPFNKCILQNVGIEASSGSVLSFLDADAVVGRDWLLNVCDRLDGLTKLCYRVRRIPCNISCLVGADDEHFDREAVWAFENWTTLGTAFPLAFEGREKPETDRPYGEPLFGNSQFSIRREVLGDLRFDEEYEGAGFEDIAMNRAIWRQHYTTYRADMPTEPERCILHISHSRLCSEQPHWRHPEFLTRNMRRYYET